MYIYLKYSICISSLLLPSAACRGPLWSCLRQAANADTCLTCRLTVCIAAWQTLHTSPSPPTPTLPLTLPFSLYHSLSRLPLSDWPVRCFLSLSVTSIYLFATSVASRQQTGRGNGVWREGCQAKRVQGCREREREIESAVGRVVAAAAFLKTI